MAGGRILLQIQCNMTSAVMSVLSTKTKTLLTGVRGRVKEYLTLTLYFLVKLIYFLLKSALQQFRK